MCYAAARKSCRYLKGKRCQMHGTEHLKGLSHVECQKSIGSERYTERFLS